ncbi:MAG: hypothetical protein E7051_09120 [Lentisphaerae bacterium]|nr:hypothetical protein [Lentisphaerota bacterium]MBQ4329989.1 hypothetical protein [Lentisphaeria bacterium]
MLKKIFFAAVIAVLSGCCCTKNNTPATESDANETFEIGGRVVEAVISGNFSDFAAAAGENSSEKTAKEFSESRKELIRNYGELCSFRRFGTLQTPLFVNIFYAVKFKRTGSEGQSIEHEQLMQLLFGRKDDSWQLVGMRFI